MTSGMMSADPTIPREDPDLNADELTVLGQYLDFHRATLAMKCARLSESDLKRRAIPTSNLTLLGLVRHLTDVEHGWFREWLDGQPERPRYFTDDDPDGDFDNLDSPSGRRRLDGLLRPGCRVATHSGHLHRRRRAGPRDAQPSGRPRNVRWILAHMVEEYARHNGHADLLREAIDGETGE